MTVRQLLESLDSQELAEWYIIEDLDGWKKRLAEKEVQAPSSDYVIKALFGKSIESGEVTWQEKPQ